MLMKKNTIVLLSLFLFMGAILNALPINETGESPFIEIVKNIRAAVVNIKTEAEISTGGKQRVPFDDDLFKFFFPDLPKNRKSVSMGSGFIFEKDESDVFIMTNAHVVEHGKEGTITVTLADKAKYEAKVVGSDKLSDIAIIKITVEEEDEVTIAKLGNSADLEIGAWAIAIGNPFGELGLERTVTAGVISATNRSNLNFGKDSPIYQDYIQTDAAINPGNSGGPLINIHGEVIGVNAAITSPAGGNVGIGFAIPINLAKKVAFDLMESGKVERAYLGILPQEITAELSKTLDLERVYGVLVAEVEENTPADKAGLEKMDVIVKFNGKPVPNVSRFRIAVANSPVGEDVSITVIRNGRERILTAELTKYPEQELTKASPTKTETDLGLDVASLSSNFAQQYKIEADHGVVITNIARSSPAANSELSVGDVIMEVNRNEIENIDDFREQIAKVEQLREAEEKKIVLFYVKKRSGASRFVTVTLD